MTTFGYDVSHHQGGFDHDQAYAQGMRFCYAKCTEGEGFQDALWPANRDGALDAGLFVAGYHFLRSDSPVRKQADNVAAWLGDVPLVIDCEPYPDGSTRPTLDTVRRFIVECAERGVFCTLLYLPRWYWQELGSPEIAGLPPIIQSHYGDDQPGDPTELYPGDDSTRWDYADHITPLMLQFTRRGRVAGQSVDVDAFRGPVADLAQWFRAPSEEGAMPLELSDVLNPHKPAEEQVKVRRSLLDAANGPEQHQQILSAIEESEARVTRKIQAVADELPAQIAQAVNDEFLRRFQS